MARKKYGNTAAKNAKWIKEGRGLGRGCDYKPWLTVRDVPSDGRVHRIFGHKSQRTHHLLSDLELAVFFLLEWNSQVVDVREQFPLQVELTKKLAIDAQIPHPFSNKTEQYLSSDFLVDTDDSERPRYALQAKYTNAFNKPRTIEKLELERRYWLEKKVPWYLVTERDIPKSIIKNIEWLYPAQRDDIDQETLVEWVQFYSHHFKVNGNKKVIEVCKQLDIAYQLEIGQSLLEVRQLLANRCFYFDMNRPAHQLYCNELKAENMTHLVEALYVSNQ